MRRFESCSTHRATFAQQVFSFRLSADLRFEVDSTHDDRIILLEVCMTTLGPYLPVLRENLLIYNGFRFVLARFRHRDYP